MALGKEEKEGFGLVTRSNIPSLVSFPSSFSYGSLNHIVIIFTKMEGWKQMTLHAEG